MKLRSAALVAGVLFACSSSDEAKPKNAVDAGADSPVDSGKDSGDAPVDSGPDASDVACQPLTCAPNQCGTRADGCGGNLDCGTCAWPDTCGGAGVPGVCGVVATLADYWQGSARFRLEGKLTLASTGWPYGYGAGSHIEVVGDTWYLFSRKVHWGDKPPTCPFEKLSTEVRASKDHGKTWSTAVEILSTAAGTDSECAATDGDAWFDANAQKWHYLFQCLRGGASPWKGCHATRDGTDPMGPFVTDTTPAVESGQLWKSICDAPTDDCSTIPGGVGKVFDEGTFEIILHDGANYWVGFHGYDGVRGYRGIAKTPDFHTWIAGKGAEGLPTDAIFDAKDAVGWREGWQGSNIGGGAATTLAEGGYYYMAIEVADLNLGCTAGQNWDIGLLRAPSLATTTWEELPAKNPIYYSSRAPEQNGKSSPCNVQYFRLFRDGQTTWAHVTRETTDPAHAGIYLYRLVPDHNLLRNADLWMCDATAWSKFPLGPTNLAVHRLPNGSSDGTCYLATNCGADPCQAGQSIYQDVDVSIFAGKKLSFGGKFLAEGGVTNLEVVVHELDAQSAIVATHVASPTLGASYVDVKDEFVVNPSAHVARYQLYLKSAVTIRADEMFLEERGN